MNFRQVHLDFHTSEKIDGIGSCFSKEQFQDALKRGHVNSITVFSKCHHGWAYHPSEANEMHPGLKFDLLDAEIKAAHEIGVKTPVYLSAGFDEKIVEAMRKLCGKADIITPNITEASLLTCVEYREAGTYDEDYIKKTLVKLTELGPKTAAITGVRYKSAPDKQGVVGYDRESGEFSSYYQENLPVSCHGTGDVFASTMFAALLRGKPLLEAEKIAVEMTVDCIKHTIGDKEHWYSVKFEECIPDLIKML